MTTQTFWLLQFFGPSKSTKYETGRFREGSETQFPKPKPNFASFWTNLVSFWTFRKFFWVLVLGIGFQSLPEIGQFRIVQLTQKISVLQGLNVEYKEGRK